MPSSKSVPPPPLGPERLGFAIGECTAKGMDRKNNQDTLLHWSSIVRRGGEYIPFSLGIVADGVGGYEGGEDASELAARVVSQEILQEVYLPFIDEDPDAAPPQPINEVLITAAEHANRLVGQELEGAGTTLTAALLMGNTAFFLHVGDSRAYLIHDDRIQHLTHDHSLVGRLVEVGAISESEALTHPHRNIIYRSIGQEDELQADWFSIDVQPDSIIMLCSDGVWGSIPDSDMLAIIDSSASAQSACRSLIQAARRGGSTDDATCILIPWGNPINAGKEELLPNSAH